MWKNLKYVMIILVCASCASKVTYDYDIKTKFSKYKTYHYFSDVGDGLGRLDIKRFTRAIDSHLDSLGLKKVENPSFYINVIAERTEYQAEDAGFGFGVSGRNFGGGVTTSVNFGAKKVNEKIIVDFVDSSTNEIFWQGFLDNNIKERMKTKDRVFYIEKIIAQIMKNFPPKGRP